MGILYIEYTSQNTPYFNRYEYIYIYIVSIQYTYSWMLVTFTCFLQPHLGLLIAHKLLCFSFLTCFIQPLYGSAFNT